MFFLKLHTHHTVEKLVLEQFIKISKLSIYLNQQFEMLFSLFVLYVQVKAYQNISKLRC